MKWLKKKDPKSRNLFPFDAFPVARQEVLLKDIREVCGQIRLLLFHLTEQEKKSLSDGLETIGTKLAARAMGMYARGKNAAEIVEVLKESVSQSPFLLRTFRVIMESFNWTV